MIVAPGGDEGARGDVFAAEIGGDVLHAESGDALGELDGGGDDFALVDGLFGLGLSVESDDLDAAGFAGLFDGDDGAEGHGVVDGEDRVELHVRRGCAR